MFNRHWWVQRCLRWVRCLLSTWARSREVLRVLLELAPSLEMEPWGRGGHRLYQRSTAEDFESKLHCTMSWCRGFNQGIRTKGVPAPCNVKFWSFTPFWAFCNLISCIWFLTFSLKIQWNIDIRVKYRQRKCFFSLPKFRYYIKMSLWNYHDWMTALVHFS